MIILKSYSDKWRLCLIYIALVYQSPTQTPKTRSLLFVDEIPSRHLSRSLVIESDPHVILKQLVHMDQLQYLFLIPDIRFLHLTKLNTELRTRLIPPNQELRILRAFHVIEAFAKPTHRHVRVQDAQTHMRAALLGTFDLDVIVLDQFLVD